MILDFLTIDPSHLPPGIDHLTSFQCELTGSQQMLSIGPDGQLRDEDGIIIEHDEEVEATYKDSFNRTQTLYLTFDYGQLVDAQIRE